VRLLSLPRLFRLLALALAACGGNGGARSEADAGLVDAGADRPGPTPIGTEDATAAAPSRCSPLVAIGNESPVRPVYLQNAATGHSLGIVGTNELAGITTSRHVASAGQRWRLTAEAAGPSPRWKLRSEAATALCLRPIATGVGLGACDNDGGWQIIAINNGVYRLVDPASRQNLGVPETTGENPALGLTTATSPGATWVFVDSGYRASGTAACDDPTLDEMTFLATHNAFHNSAEGAKLLPNQTRSLAQQLEDGVRGFQLDVYDYNGAIWTCHGSCLVSGLRGRPLAEHLTTIATFLTAYPNEIVTLFLEDRVGRAADLCAVVDSTAGVAALVFDPERADVRTRGWPRRSELMAKNQRLLLFSQRAGREACGIAHDQRFISENFWSLGPPGNGDAPADLSCTSRWANQILGACGPGGFRPLFVMNHYRDAMWPVQCAADNGAPLRRRAFEICAQAGARKPNFIAVDCYDVGDGRTVVTELNRCDPEACRCP
jgi:hypothetical protein